MLIRANRFRGITKDITITNAASETIVPGANDEVRVIIGREGRVGVHADNFAEAKLVIATNASTNNGSTLTANYPSSGLNRLRLDASDLTFNPGAYSCWIEMFDDEDSDEWKLVDKQVFYLEE